MQTKLKQIAQLLKTELAVYRLVLRHAQTPIAAKVLLGLAVGYVLLPFDLIPDFIPLIGHLDDAIIVPGLIYLALHLIPEQVMTECRMRVTKQV